MAIACHAATIRSGSSVFLNWARERVDSADMARGEVAKHRGASQLQPAVLCVRMHTSQLLSELSESEHAQPTLQTTPTAVVKAMPSVCTVVYVHIYLYFVYISGNLANNLARFPGVLYEERLLVCLIYIC